MGLIIHSFANGWDASPVQNTEHIPTVKSVGNRATTPRDLVCNDDVKLMLILLAESVCCRMRELSSKCTVVEVYVRSTDLNSFIRQRKLQIPSCSSAEMADVAFDLFRQNYGWEKPVRSIGVRGAGLIPAYETVQMSLFAEDCKRQRWEQIDKTVDTLRQRYGYMSIQRAILKLDPQLGSIAIVKEWLYQLMHTDRNIVRSPRSYNSQIGVPLSVWQLTPDTNLGIFEAGISKTNEMDRIADIIRPTIGILTNIGDTHQANFDNFRQKTDEIGRASGRERVLRLV